MPLRILLLREEMTSDGNRRLLNTMEASALRGANIVRQVLAFGRGIEGQKTPLQPRHLLREMAQIIRETFPKSITLRVLCPNDLWTVTGNATQLHQVLMNLCVNARDALTAGGALTLAAGNGQLDDTFAGTVERLQPGPYVLLTVTDTGRQFQKKL
jgi:two-component system cell cycle sensor histidine kinase/response regulator CckA